jgi:hypothetical protein
MHAIRSYSQDRPSRTRGFRRLYAVGALVLVTAVSGVFGQESSSRSVTVVNHAPANVTVSEAISRSVTVVNHSPVTMSPTEAISRSMTACNRAGFVDSDGDGVHDCDDKCPGFDDRIDRDRDGIPDSCDNCPDHANPEQADCDHDGVGDVCAIAEGLSNDCNLNGIPDECESLADCNNDGVPDICEPDCNGNGVADSCDIERGTSEDCTGNGIPDECEPDCNHNGIADSCDIARGVSADCAGNGIPDECEPDCNGNGVADSCDIRSGLSNDCNANSVPDECEQDCNHNGRADACDVADGTSEDCNGDGVPDECSGTPATDVVRSGTIDLADFAAVQNCFGPNAQALGVCANADIDGDGKVASADFVLLQAAIGSHTITPDMIVSGLSFDGRIVLGGDLALIAKLTNVGCSSATGALGVVTTLAPDDGTNSSAEVMHREHEVELVNLTPQGSIDDAYIVTVPDSVAAGTYVLRVCADSTPPRCADGCDADSTNNCAQSSLEITDMRSTVHLSSIDAVDPLVSGPGHLVWVGIENPTPIAWTIAVDLYINNLRVGSCEGTAPSGPSGISLPCYIQVPVYDLVCAETKAVDLSAMMKAWTTLLTGTIMDEKTVPVTVRASWWDIRFNLKNVPSTATVCSRTGWDIEVCNVGGVISDDVCFFSGINLFPGPGNWVNTNLGLAYFNTGRLAPDECATFHVRNYLVDYPDGIPCNAARGTQYVKAEINYYPGGCFDHCSTGNFAQRAITIR